MVRQVKQLIEGFAENGEMLRELEQIVDLAHDDAMRRLREEFPKMKESDVRLLCYIFGGFSPQVISLFMNDTVVRRPARVVVRAVLESPQETGTQNADYQLPKNTSVRFRRPYRNP